MGSADGRWVDLYLTRAVRIGAHASAAALAALVIFRFLPGGDRMPSGVFIALWLAAAAGTVIAYTLPWDRLFRSETGMRLLYAWSLVDILLITGALIASGSGNPSFFVLYALTTIFFAPTYPPRMQVGLFLFTMACYLFAVSVTDLGVSVADHFLRLAALGLVTFMASFTARELKERMEVEGAARAELASEFADLQRADELFRAVSELASDYVYSMTVAEDGSLAFDWVSGAFARVTGYDVEEFEWEKFVHPDDLPAAQKSFEGVLKGEKQIQQWRVVTATGDERCIVVYVHPVWDPVPSRVVRIYGAVQDITEQKHNEDALKDTNSLLQATLESTADGILVVDTDGRMVAFNQKFVDMWRIPQDVAESGDDDQALAIVQDQVEDPDGFMEKVRALYADREAESFDIVHFRDGRIFERYSQPQVVEDRVVGRVWSFRDVTGQRRGEQRVRETLEALREADAERRRLLTHLVRAKEEERGRVAADIHDDSVQVMTSVAIDLERLAKGVGDSALKGSLARLEETVRAAIKRLRSMVFELKPPSLVEEGLVSALCMYLEEFTAETGIEYELTNRLEAEPPEETRIALYRISQEALTNVRKHADARKVDLFLGHVDGEIALRIADDGRGLGGKPLGAPGHIGVSEMRERAEILGGRLEIQPRSPNGTVVRALVPLEDRTREPAVHDGTRR